MVDRQESQPAGCPVYDWDDRDKPYDTVHLVADEAMATQRLSSNCGAMPGKSGWHVWRGEVPAERWCDACLSRPVPKLPDNLTEAQLEGRACLRCGAEHEPRRPVEAWSRRSSHLFECIDVEACARRKNGWGS
jgi:hypothetical protein